MFLGDVSGSPWNDTGRPHLKPQILREEGGHGPVIAQAVASLCNRFREEMESLCSKGLLKCIMIFLDKYSCQKYYLKT